MKKTILLAGWMACALPVFSQDSTTDRQQVETMIQLYFDGWATGDTVKLGRAMHSSCHLKNYRDGKFIEYTRNEYLALFKPHPRPKQLETRIVSIDLTHGMGSAKIELSTERDLFTDYFNLMKTSAGWVIADKVSTRVSHRTVDINAIQLRKDTVMEGLKRPWSIAFLSEDEALVSEKDGDLLKVNLRTREKTPIGGFPADMADSIVTFGDNTGKFDVLVDPDFTRNKYVYLSYATQRGVTRTTRIIRAVFDNDRLHQLKTLFIAEPYTHERFHYGGGMAFGSDGNLYFTIGNGCFPRKTSR